MADRSGRRDRTGKYEDAWQKLYIALRILAGTGAIKERLIKAWRSGIYKLADHLLDKNLTAELTMIRDALTAKTDPETGKGSVAVTVAQMSEEEACHWSMRIVDLAVDATRITAFKSFRLFPPG
jgi:hypothetical protein